MNERLLNFLHACDKSGNWDLATQALVDAIEVQIAGESIHIEKLAELHPAGIQAWKLAIQGRDLQRTQLRSLAELELAIESYASNSDQRDKEVLLEGLAQVLSRGLPKPLGNSLTRISRSGSSIPNAVETAPKSSQVLYILVAGLVFLVFIGSSAIPSAILMGEMFWYLVLLPLGCAALLGLVIWRIVLPSR